MVMRLFHCACGVEVRDDYEATPSHCGHKMTPGRPLFPGASNHERQLHMIKLMKDPVVDWQLPGKPDLICELWQLKPAGRSDPRSEFLGYLGRRMTTWEWVPPNGVGIPGGFSASAELAAQCLLLAMDGGGPARRAIEQISVKAKLMS